MLVYMYVYRIEHCRGFISTSVNERVFTSTIRVQNRLTESREAYFRS